MGTQAMTAISEDTAVRSGRRDPQHTIAALRDELRQATAKLDHQSFEVRFLRTLVVVLLLFTAALLKYYSH